MFKLSQIVDRIKSLVVIGLKLSVPPAYPQFSVSGPLSSYRQFTAWLVSSLRLAAEWDRVLHILRNPRNAIPSPCHILDRSKSQTPPTLKGRKLHKGMNTRSWRSLGTTFGSGKSPKVSTFFMSIQYCWPLDCIECSGFFEESSRKIKLYPYYNNEFRSNIPNTPSWH